MYYAKCMKNNTCKTCSDYMFCKDDTRDNRKRKRDGNNESKSIKRLSRQNNKQVVQLR